MHQNEHPKDEYESMSLVSTRYVDIVVALLLLALATIAIVDSVRVGYGWDDTQGPQPGFFPFIVSMLLAISSVVAIVRAVFFPTEEHRQHFVSVAGAKRVLLVLVPLAVYILGIGFVGIYVASAAFIAGFMLAFGRQHIWKSLIVGLGVPLALYFMFERWFLVPLPKGPLEAWLGL
jgi:hypothetical protein